MAPKCCSSTSSFVAIACVYTLVCVMMEVYFLAVLTSVEKQFGFSSSQTGIIISVKEFIHLALTGILSHFGYYAHRPRMLSICGFIGCAGGLVSVLPYYIVNNDFTVDLNTTLQSDADSWLLCKSSLNLTNSSISHSVGSPACEDQSMDSENPYNHEAFVFFVFGSVLNGIAMAPVNALIVTYIDDIALESKKGFYLGLTKCMGPFGPLVSFVLGGMLTRVHVNLEDPGYGPSDTRWIGAWWLGYYIVPSLLAISSTIIFFYPRHMDNPNLPKEDTSKHNSSLSSEKEEKDTRQQNIVDILKGLPATLCRLLGNPIFMLLVFGGASSSYVVTAFFPFLIKFLEVQFNQSASTASLITGALISTMAGIGVFIGGYLMSIFKPNLTKIALAVFLINTVFSLMFLVLMFVDCDAASPDRQGEPQFNSTIDFMVCQSNCDCNGDLTHLVCGSDGVNYLTPCLAGCQTQLQNQTYTECGCIEDSHQMAHPGVCHTNCRSQFILYIALLSLGAMLGMSGGIPALTILLRAVHEEDRSLGLAFASTLIGIIASVPGPMIYGKIIDSTCLVWQQTCKGRGSCALYDDDQFRYKFHSTTAAIKIIAGIFYFLVWLFLKRKWFILPTERQKTVEVNVGDNTTKSEVDSLLHSNGCKKTVEEVLSDQTERETQI